VIPDRMFLPKGVGRHKERLTSFEMALRDAKIAAFNLVQVSSILPPGRRLVSRSQGLGEIRPGTVVFCVMAETSTNEPNRLIAASVGVAIPKDPSEHGYLSEHHSYGQTERTSGDYAEELAAEMLATTLGVEFDSNQSWDEKREIWKISGRIVNTRNITQSAIGDRDGRWTTVVAAAILLSTTADDQSKAMDDTGV
jgi:arginine decarboxylase